MKKKAHMNESLKSCSEIRCYDTIQGEALRHQGTTGDILRKERQGVNADDKRVQTTQFDKSSWEHKWLPRRLVTYFSLKVIFSKD